MSLTNKLGSVIDCGHNSDGTPDSAGVEVAKQQLFEIIKNARLFPKKGNLLDIGSGKKGTYVVNRLGKEFPRLNITYLDSELPFLKNLNKNNKICANASKMPFKDESMDIAYAMHVLRILRDYPFFGSESYLIAKEAYRVLKPGSWLIFNCGGGNAAQTFENLLEIGFREAVLLQRVIWSDLPTDIYAVKK
jgi:ubiquinone/menaquinone biosynthesis C-methylase UbiE